MRKILIIADGLFKKEEIEAPGIANKLKCFEKYGAEVDIACDNTTFIFDDPHIFIRKIEKDGPEWIEPQKDVLNKITDAEILIVHYSGVSSELINAAKKLKFIGVMRSGVENVCVAAAKAKGIVVSNSPGRVAEPVADFTIGLILAASRNIVSSSLIWRQGDWMFPEKEEIDKIKCLRDQKVGIIGFGIIGEKVAERLKPFGVEIVVYDPYCPKERITRAGCKDVSLHKLLCDSDFVTIHARLSEETKNMIGEKELAMMKPSAILINAARAGLVDEAALISILQKRAIRGAALDVFNQEPLPKNHPLLKLDNVTLTPHLAGLSGDIVNNSFNIILQELDRYFNNQKLMNVIN